METDSKNLIILLYIRQILSKSPDSKTTIVSQMLDQRNRAVSEQAKTDDFIISEKLVSQYLAQLSENKYLFPLYNELFTAGGCEIYFKDIINYIEVGEETNYATVVKAALCKYETAIGYRKKSLYYNSNENYGVKLNPDKDEKLIFDSTDQVIVISRGT